MAAPLEGIKVVDFGIFLAGPGSVKLLSDLGATVIKVEELGGDPLRGAGSRELGSYSVFHQAMAGKRGIAIDLKTKEGQEIAHRLIAQADVVAESFRTASVATRLGIDYEQCKRINPQIIYVSAPGYGNTGPRAGLGIAEPLNSTFAGVHYNSGGKGNPPTGSTSFDQFCALLGANSILMALYHRAHTGEGQYIDNTQLALVLYYNAQAFLGADGKLVVDTEVDSMQTGFEALDRLYRTQDGWLAVVAQTDRQWKALCKGLGLDELTKDARFTTTAKRRANSDALTALLEPRLLTKTTAEWMPIFEREGAPVEAPAKHGQTRAMMSDEYLKSGWVHEVEHENYPAIRVPAAGVKLSDTPLRPSQRPPRLSEHAREILTDLGYSNAEIAEFGKKRIIVLPEDARATARR